MGGGTWHCARWFAGKTSQSSPTICRQGKGSKEKTSFNNSMMNTGEVVAGSSLSPFHPGAYVNGAIQVILPI